MTSLRVPLASPLPTTGKQEATVRALTGDDEARVGRARTDRAGQHGPAHDDAWGDEAWVDTVLALVVDGLSVDGAAALPVGDRHALLLGLVAATYTPRLSWVVDCGSCGAPLDADLAVADLLQAAPVLPGDDVPAHRLPTGADLTAVAGLPADLAAAALLARCVDEPAALDDAGAAAVQAAMAAADPLADVVLDLVCAACGRPVPTEVDPVAELAHRLPSPADLLADVHGLALAYGWTEPEVLALPRPRRQEYLVLVADLAGAGELDAAPAGAW